MSRRSSPLVRRRWVMGFMMTTYFYIFLLLPSCAGEVEVVSVDDVKFPDGQKPEIKKKKEEVSISRNSSSSDSSGNNKE